MIHTAGPASISDDARPYKGPESHQPAATPPFIGDDAKPYKGPESYRVEDSDLFFGRDSEARQIVAKILSSRFTVLHAQSGAGKTSLLNARVIPGLEMKGAIAFRVLLQNDPIESIRVTTLHNLLPPPEAELWVLEQTLRALAEPGEDPSLNDLLDRFDRLLARDRRRRVLPAAIEIARPEVGMAASLPDEKGPVNSMFSRLLRSTIEVEDFAEHLSAIAAEGGVESSPHAVVSGDSRVSFVMACLRDPKLAASYQMLMGRLYVPVPDLWTFFENLVHTYGQRRSRFMLVLILDQFEELFTRFVDPGPVAPALLSQMPDWRLRPEFFEQFERLYTTDLPKPAKAPEDVAGAKLPIRYVVSMRDEYIAQLDPFRSCIENLESSSYHLSLLTTGQAKEAIQQPATLFGYSYSSDCYKAVVNQLSKEGRFVEPSQLQIVCEKLWNIRGKELANLKKDTNDAGQGFGNAPTNAPAIERRVLTDQGDTLGILRSFFRDFLKDLDQDSRLETLEMLQPLFTVTGTRNIIARDTLVNAPFRNPERRVCLLANLEKGKIVRVERRLGGFFVEITHEFLIRPILEAVRDELNRDPEYSRFRWALRTLEQAEKSEGTFGKRRRLTLQEFTALDTNRSRIVWTAATHELMLEAAIAYGAATDVLRYWMSVLPEEVAAPDVSAILSAISEAGEGTPILRLEELRELNSIRSSLELSRSQLLLILRSELVWAGDSERDDIAYWTGRTPDYEQRAGGN